MKISIFTEDGYGPAFIKQLIPLLKANDLIPRETIITDSRKYPLCNPKLGNMVKASLEVAERSVVLTDANGGDLDSVMTRTLNHVKKEDRSNVSIVVLDYEIEEWICSSKSYRLNAATPTYVLETREMYEKYRLPDYARQLDLAKLSRDCGSFRRFLAAIRGHSS